MESSYGQAKRAGRGLSGLEVLSALVTPALGSEGRRDKYKGYMRMQMRHPPYLWRRRWIQVWLEALGDVSRVIVRADLGSASTVANVPVERSRDTGRATRGVGGRVTKLNECGAEFSFVDGDNREVRLRTEEALTPAPLIAALACLCWPGDDPDALRLLVAFGNTREAAAAASAAVPKDFAHLREIRVPLDADPGVVVQGWRVPPGVARGHVFYVPASEHREEEEEAPENDECPREVDDLIERFVSCNVIDHEASTRLRRAPSRRLEVLSRYYSRHGDFRRLVTTASPSRSPRSLVVDVDGDGLTWKFVDDETRVEPTKPEPLAAPRVERRKVRFAVPAGAVAGSRVAVDAPGRSLTLEIPAAATAGTMMTVSYGVTVTERWPEYPFGGAPAERSAWRRDRLTARLDRLRSSDVVDVVVDRSKFLESLFEEERFLTPQEETTPDWWRSRWRLTFRNEPGKDAGGLGREFWTLVSRSFFGPDFGLFAPTASSGKLRPSPAAVDLFPDGPPFRCAGRFLAKALLDGQTLDVSLNRPLLSHILGLAVAFDDLRFLDEALHRNLTFLLDVAADDDLDLLCQAFAVTDDGQDHTTTDLIPDGRHIDVNESNKTDYVEKRFAHAVTADRAAIAAVVAGFYDVVPRDVLLGDDPDSQTRFTPERLDAADLDLLLVGQVDIDVDDWIDHLNFRLLDPDSPRVDHFKRLLRDLSPEQRRRLLQWATGSARLPPGGFRHLPGGHDNHKPFELASTDADLPRAHTCFNRIDLPAYPTYDHFKDVFTNILDNDVTGFGLE